MYGDEFFNNPIVDLAGYREDRTMDNVVSFEIARLRYSKFNRRLAGNSGREGDVIYLAARRMAAFETQYV